MHSTFHVILEGYEYAGRGRDQRKTRTLRQIRVFCVQVFNHVCLDWMELPLIEDEVTPKGAGTPVITSCLTPIAGTPLLDPSVSHIAHTQRKDWNVNTKHRSNYSIISHSFIATKIRNEQLQ